MVIYSYMCSVILSFSFLQQVNKHRTQLVLFLKHSWHDVHRTLAFLPQHLPVCLCLPVFFDMSFWASEQVYLSVHSMLCSSKLWEGPGTARQSGSAADGLSGTPLCGVLFFACLVLSSRIPFISSSVPAPTLQSSSLVLKEMFLTSFLLHIRHLLYNLMASEFCFKHSTWMFRD